VHIRATNGTSRLKSGSPHISFNSVKGGLKWDGNQKTQGA